MTSKEMEARSGVARANIRYYEAEGLLTPARMKNGYRDYSEEDLALLEKIKLLRRLGVSVQELKELRAGQAELSAVLDRRLAELQGERLSQQRVETVCGALRRSGETFSTLNAPKYLSDLDAPSLPPSQSGSWWAETPAAPLPAADTLPPAPGFLRRLLARAFDFWLAVFLTLTGISLLGGNIAQVNDTLLGFALQAALLFLEPLLIHLWGATPGKALLGLRLAGPDGTRLSYGEAVTRHLRMLWSTMGFGIPILSLVQAFRSARRCWREDPHPWDEDIAYTAAPVRVGRRTLAGLAVLAVLALAGEAANSASQLPPNRGDLTVAEFAENYNRQARYLGLDLPYELDEAGQRRDKSQEPGGGVTISLPATGGWPEDSGFRYTVRDGRITALSWTLRAENTDQWLSFPVNELVAAVTALVWAQEDVPFWTGPRMALVEDLAENWDLAPVRSQAGVTIAQYLQHRNFEISAGLGLLIPEDETDNFFSWSLTMTLAE